VPLVGHAAQRPHQSLSADGDRNVVDGVKYLLSGVALDGEGRDRVGAVMIVDEVVFAAREVTKVDARPGGYEPVGGHGGIVADMGGYGPPQLTYAPARLATYRSEVCLSRLPEKVNGTTGSLEGGVRSIGVRTKSPDGDLLAEGMPLVSLVKYARYQSADASADLELEVEIMARIAANLAGAPLAGFVGEGMSPYGLMTPRTSAALAVATASGMPVVRVGRGNTGGMAYKLDPRFISGNNLSATKARLLLMAAMLKLGAFPIAADPFAPTEEELGATVAAVTEYQAIFDSH
jgi:hypothetical protein